MMKAYAIVINGNDISETGYKTLVNSSNQVNNDFEIIRYNAITPKNVESCMEQSGIKWNYPWEGQVTDFSTGLVKTAYTTANPLKRIACAMSHFYLWQMSLEKNEPLLILEHDSVFTNKIDFDIIDTRFKVLGVNNPLGATRRARLYHDKIQSNNDLYQQVPYIDDIKVPQGLAGNSAYIVTPHGAKALISKVFEVGLWPNDAIMCRQLFSFLGVTKKYYTGIQKLPSTTTL
jgi:GR25 family glycosyltransferase involved in LPS biosynthesis